jgi:hypothetical protein
VLDRYARERLLYRLSQSPHGSAFVLKGATLFTLWFGHPHRATKDIDLLGTGAPDLDRLVDVFRDLCALAVDDDGTLFDPTSVSAARIKEDAAYEGVRIHLVGTLGSAVLNLQVDVGFGDIVTPLPLEADFPVLLGSSVPRLRVYPPETVIAEKLEAMVQLGIANSRMKDFFDVRFLGQHVPFDGSLLTRAIGATFERRGTGIPDEPPVAWTPAFTDDPQKKAQWTAFLRRSGVADIALPLAEVVAGIQRFLGEPLEALRTQSAFTKTWSTDRWT